jgi:integrase
MRAVDLDMTSDDCADPSKRLWFYCPADHKTAHHGHKRRIYLNSRAQEIIRPFLSGRAVDAFLFSPAEAEAERHTVQREHRRSPVQPSQVQRAERAARRKQKRAPGQHYTEASYRRAIARGCVQADRQAHRENPTIPQDQVIVPTWHPHRLRHNAATVIRREFGLEMAKVILGHKSVAVTEIYAEADEAKAREAMRRIG